MQITLSPVISSSLIQMSNVFLYLAHHYPAAMLSRCTNNESKELLIYVISFRENNSTYSFSVANINNLSEAYKESYTITTEKKKRRRTKCCEICQFSREQSMLWRMNISAIVFITRTRQWYHQLNGCMCRIRTYKLFRSMSCYCTGTRSKNESFDIEFPSSTTWTESHAYG